MKFYFHPEADAELDEAVRYYEDCEPGLGRAFAEEVYAAIARISEYPSAWPTMSIHTRRCLINRFPYGIVFRVKSAALRIIAVSELHRRPGYWKERR
jgi:plasmid stabilization system protein ParE